MITLASLALWRDRAGRPSPLRIVTLAILVAPFLVLGWRVANGDLGPRPLTEALRFCGDRAIETLLASIAVSPLRTLSGLSRLADVRRMIGVTAFLWAGAHVGLHLADQSWALGKVATEIAVRPWLALGFVALVGLAALAATSTDGMIRRLGGARWRRLHGLVHPIALVALLHFFLQIRLDPAPVALAAGTAFGLFLVRRSLATGLGATATLILAGAGAWGGAAAIELAWFAAKTRRPLLPIAEANFDTDFRIAASWWAAAILALLVGTALAWRTRRAITRA